MGAVLTSRKSDKTTGYDIFLIAGQSNTFYGLPNTADTIPDSGGLDSTDADIKQLGRFTPNIDTVMAGSEPLEHNDALRAGHVGWALAFAKWYKTHYLVSGRQILLIPCGVGSTGFADNYWNEGDAGYNDLVARANIAKALTNGTHRIKALLWHQGEKDAALSRTTAQYKSDWLAMIAALETDISESNLVCVAGGLMPYHVNLPTSNYPDINTALSELPASRTYTGFADPQTPSVIENEVGTNQTSDHFSVRANRGYPTQDFDDVSTIGFAGRYATAYVEALNNR